MKLWMKLFIYLFTIRNHNKILLCVILSVRIYDSVENIRIISFQC